MTNTLSKRRVKVYRLFIFLLIPNFPQAIQNFYEYVLDNHTKLPTCLTFCICMTDASWYLGIFTANTAILGSPTLRGFKKDLNDLQLQFSTLFTK